MIDINPELVCDIITKAHEFHAKEQVVIPEEPESSSDDWALQVLADHAEDMTLQEVKAAVEDLEALQRAELVALMWIGRGDFDGGEWEEALREAAESANDRTAEYLMSTPLVADYLQDGLHQLGYDCNE